MLRYLLTLVVLPAIIMCCRQEDKENAKEVSIKVFSVDSISSTFFTINTQKDTTIRSVAGTILRIYKNSFIDSNGNTVAGDINVELKEALTPASMVLGNLLTISDGSFLESGGMIYVNANQNNKPLRMADDKIIGIMMPKVNADSNMQVYEGVKDSSGINWVKPTPLLNDEIKLIRSQNIRFTFTSEAFAVTDSIKNKTREDDLQIKANEISNVLSAEYIDIQQDTTVEIKGDKVRMTKPVITRNKIDTLQGGVMRFMNEASLPKGYNYFIEDYNIKYVFAMKQLGWANIDKLYNDSRTREVNLVTTIKNAADFKTVNVSMVLPNKKMYIPGYQKKDNTFSFTHNDEEKALLPVGEKATIIATAYKKGTPYFTTQNITISADQTVSLSLTETTMDKLKQQVEAGL